MSGSVKQSSLPETTIGDLPDVLLEYILCQLPAYGDLINCKLVCKLWNRCVHSAVKKSKRDFRASLKLSTLQWTDYSSGYGPNISGRYSHSCCVYRNLMFVFGGCTSANTTFNDLWAFDLATRVWIRPLVTGSYPPPKACATLVQHEDSLILFGGWAHSSPYPLHQDWKLFNQLHKFDVNYNRWTLLSSKTTAPSVAGHAASVIGNEMIVFGGLVNDQHSNAFVPTNDLCVFNFETLSWRKPLTSSPRPQPRYGHSQLLLDDHNILVCGGCGGPNKLLNDVWLLVMGEEWLWVELQVTLSEGAIAPIIGLHQACKVDEFIVFLNKGSTQRPMEASKDSPVTKKIERHQYFGHSSGKQSQPKLQPQPTKQERRQRLFEPFGKPSVRPNARCDRSKQIQCLNRMEQKIKDMRSSNVIRVPTVKYCSKNQSNCMSLFVLDISKASTEGFVTWLAHQKSKGPEDRVLYSLVAGVFELVMFGGVQRAKSAVDMDSSATEIVSNTIHVACSKPFVI